MEQFKQFWTAHKMSENVLNAFDVILDMDVSSEVKVVLMKTASSKIRRTNKELAAIAKELESIV